LPLLDVPEGPGRGVSQPAKVRASDFRFVSGEELLTFFASSPGNHRGFCRVCGSPILTRFDADSSVFGLPLGALDDDPGVRPRAHVHVASKAPWFTITDDLPQFAELPAARLVSSSRAKAAPRDRRDNDGEGGEIGGGAG
jgi:hypothetical protein